MTKSVVLSICIPTNGVSEWVFPVLDSIFNQDVDSSLYEVIVTDNGSNSQFYQGMQDYKCFHQNLIYKKTDAFEFLNEIESYNLASGILIKFINHRTKLLPGTLKYLIDFASKNQVDKPCAYFSNGVLKLKKLVNTYDCFDEYVKNLSYWSSWSTGMTFWKSDFEKIDRNEKYNTLFPHTNILFHERDKKSYIIDNKVLLDEIPTGKIPKGRYNIFFAFAVEYPSIILDLLRDKSISFKTYKSVLKDNLQFVASSYFEYIILKRKCSYELKNIKESISVFYSKRKVRLGTIKEFFIRLRRKFFKNS